MLKATDRFQLDVTKEIIRLGELRLAAQLQTRLALEARLATSMTWLIALSVLLIGLIFNLKGQPGNFWFLLVFTAVIVGLVTLMNLFMILSSDDWRYAGANPSEIVDYIVVDKPAYPLDKFVARIKNTRLLSFRIKARQTQKFFNSRNKSLDHTLHKLSLRYAEDIAYNDRLINSLHSKMNFPIQMIMLGIVIVVVVVALPSQPIQSKSNQSQSVAPQTNVPTP